VASARRAIRLLPGYPPPSNNLSLALFHNGKPDEAIAISRQVLSQHADNVHALSNLIRFLAWSGRRGEAEPLWAKLSELDPQDHDLRIKMADAAAILEDDEAVERLLSPIERAAQDDEEIDMPLVPAFRLAVARANLGRPDAIEGFRALSGRGAEMSDWIAAIEGGRGGLGLASRFPYHTAFELLTDVRQRELVALLSDLERRSPAAFRRKMDRFATRYPQVVLLAEHVLWYEGQVAAGLTMLDAIATPAAYRAMYRFATSQAGDDDQRLHALAALSRSGWLAPGDTVRIWRDGEWHEVAASVLQIPESAVSTYSADVIDLLSEGSMAVISGDLDDAERLLLRAIALEPEAKEAYNNLANVYAQLERTDEAKKMLRRAIELDPSYVLPRCNLSNYYLGEGDLERAKELLSPLADLQEVTAREQAYYLFTKAQIAVQEGHLGAARRSLQAALELRPDYTVAQQALRGLDEMEGRLDALYDALGQLEGQDSNEGWV
jgi:tetratricopeptide (TPR) repeat protein